jgi:hypothetical protein
MGRIEGGADARCPAVLNRARQHARYFIRNDQCQYRGSAGGSGAIALEFGPLRHEFCHGALARALTALL